MHCAPVCPETTTNVVTLQDGKYMGEKEAGICLECPQTKMCSGTGTVTPDPCPKGQYCAKVRNAKFYIFVIAFTFELYWINF